MTEKKRFTSYVKDDDGYALLMVDNKTSEEQQVGDNAMFDSWVLNKLNELNDENNESQELLEQIKQFLLINSEYLPTCKMRIEALGLCEKIDKVIE